jgi:hypothetical protein
MTVAAVVLLAGCAQTQPQAVGTADFQGWQVGFEPMEPVHVGAQATVTLDIRNAGAAARNFELWGVSLQIAALQPRGGYLLAQEGTAGPGARSLEAPDAWRVNEIGRKRYAATHFLVEPGGVVHVTQRLPWTFTSPGDYSVEALLPPEDPRTNRMVPLARYIRIPVATLRVVGTPPQAEPWGPEMEGISCRVRVAATNAEGPPALVMDIRNTGQGQLFTTQYEGVWQVEWDGTWYGWSDMIDAKSSPLLPGRTYRNIPLGLQTWKDAGGKPLAATPGMHTLRVATTCRAADGGADVRTESAAVRVTVPAAH